MERVYRPVWDKTTSFPRYSDEEEYDSTWEDDEEQEDSTESNVRPCARTTFRNTFAARDMQNFRHMVPKTQKESTVDDDDDDDDDEMYQGENVLPNLWFYKNEMNSRPDDVSIEEFHKEWFGKYSRLEWVHSYIQWLFPIQEPGMNSDAHVLSVKEIKYFRANEEVKERLLKSYELMLDFYGIKLLDRKTGEVARAENWEERFENLNRNTHNNLRITRILKCLGILGFQHFQAPLVRFFLQETLVNRELRRVKQSVLDYFMFAVLDKSERKELIRFAFQIFEPKQEFVWCPQRIHRRFMREMKTTPKNTEASGTGPSKCPRNEETRIQIEVESQSLVQNGLSNDGSDEGDIRQNTDEMKQENIPDPYQDHEIQTVSSKVSEGHKRTSETENSSEESSDQSYGGNTLQNANGESEKMSKIQENGSEDTNKDMSTNTNKEDINLLHQQLGCSAAATEESEVTNGSKDGEDAEHNRLVNFPGPVSSDDEMRDLDMSNDQAACMAKDRPASDRNKENSPENQSDEVLGHHAATEEGSSEVDKDKEEDSSTADKKNDSVGGVPDKNHDENESTSVPDSNVEMDAVKEIGVETGQTSETNEETQEQET